MSIQEQKITDAAVAANGVQSQPDKLTGTAAQNKKVFDNLVTAVVKARFNALIDELTGAGAAGQLGITTIPGYSAATVQAMLEQIVTAMQEITQGSVMDGSITLAKLAAEVTAVALGGAAASHNHGAANITSGTLAAARIPVLDGTKLGEGSVGTAQLGAAVVTSEKLAALAVLATHIAAGAVTTPKIAAGAVTTPKIAAKAVTAAQIADETITGGKIADGTLTREKMAADVLGIASNSRSDTTPFDAECNGKLYVVSPSTSKNFTLTAEVLAALPTGWSVTLVRGSVSTGATYTVGWEADIPVLNGNNRKMSWSGAGSISLDRAGDMVTITKWYNLPRIIVMGNTNVRNIYVGTSATPPSTWQSGDIYLQYE